MMPICIKISGWSISGQAFQDIWYVRNQWLQAYLNALTKCIELNKTALDFTDNKNTLLPDRDDVGEEQKEAEDLEIPATSEVLQSHHDQ